MNKSSIKVVLCSTVLYVLFSFNAFAITLDYGELVGVWNTPNDNTASVTSYLSGTSWALSEGQQLTELARNEDHLYSGGLVSIPLSPSIFDFHTGESTDGLWAYLGGAKVDFLAVATSSNLALYGYSSSQWIGRWTTDAISSFINSSGEGMTHITAYNISAVPLPAAAPLFASALALFGFINHRRKARNS